MTNILGNEPTILTIVKKKNNIQYNNNINRYCNNELKTHLLLPFRIHNDNLTLYYHIILHTGIYFFIILSGCCR